MSTRVPCGLLVVAHRIPSSVLERFLSHVCLSNPKVATELVVSKEEPDWQEGMPFNKSRALNSLLREALEKYEVIIQTDVDLIIPPGLIDKAYETVRNYTNLAYHHGLRHIELEEIEGLSYEQYPFKKWQHRKAIFCSGCFNAATAATWKKTRGWNEEMAEWGFEDTDMFKRSARLGVRWTVDYAMGLVHINHRPRTRRNVAANKAAAAKYDDSTDWLKGKLILK